MLVKIKTYFLLGIDAMPVDVEVDLSPAPLPKTVIVGLPEQAFRESIHRIERALVNGGFMRPHDRVVINLTPADLPKQATSFDLPIAIGILVGASQLESDVLKQYAAVGELSLEGQMRNVKGVLSIAIAAAKQLGIRGLLVPAINAQEAAVVEGLDIIPIGSLNEAVAFLSGKLQIEPVPSRLNQIYEAYSKYEVDFSDVRGQEMSKRALTIAAAGAHNHDWPTWIGRARGHSEKHPNSTTILKTHITPRTSKRLRNRVMVQEESAEVEQNVVRSSQLRGAFQILGISEGTI